MCAVFFYFSDITKDAPYPWVSHGMVRFYRIFFSIRVQLIMRCVTLPVTQNNSNGTKKSVKSSRLDDSMGNNYAGKLLHYQQNLSNFSISKYPNRSKHDEKIPIKYKNHEERTLQSYNHQRINLLECV